MRPALSSVLALSLSIAAGCATGLEDPPADLEPEVSDTSLTGNTWGPLIELRDDTETVHDGKPEGGWWVTPIHATLLPTGKVLVTGWGRRDRDHCGLHGTRLVGTTFLLDPDALPDGGTLQVRPIAEDRAPGTQDVLYCSGHSPMADGRVLFTGGARYQNLGTPGEEQEFGLDYGRVFTPASTSFARTPAMVGGAPGMDGLAWYPTNTRMPDGRVLTIGGFSRCCDGGFGNRTMQLFSAPDFDAGRSPWSLVAPHDAVPGDLVPGLRDYIHTVLLPRPVNVGGRDRTVAMMGVSGRVVYASLDDGLAAGDRFAFAPDGARPFGAPGWDATAALTSTGEFLTMGGSADNGHAQRIDLYRPETGTWRSVDTGIGRRNPSSVLLPDGTVLIVNGGNDERNFPGDRRSPQIFDPATGAVTTLSPWTGDDLDRGYHNFALLLKDGRVLIGGGISTIGGIGCERPDLRLYDPPYFSKGPQPVIADAGVTLDLATGGAPVAIATSGPAPRAEGGVVLMATGSTTHAFDQNQRFVRLGFSRQGDTLVVTPPATALEAPPGDYIMFVVSDAGVPSAGRAVRVTAAPQPTPDIRRTVIFIGGATVPGQDMFVRGGLDHDAMLAQRGVTCTAANGRCAIPIRHRNPRNATTAPWKEGDGLLDWYGPEASQNRPSHGIRAAGTALDWTTSDAANPHQVAVDGFGFEPLNDVGEHLWMLDVDMDCARGFRVGDASHFEVKSFIAGPGAPGWEGDIHQAGAPYRTRNHVGTCGMINVFSRDDDRARVLPFP